MKGTRGFTLVELMAAVMLAGAVLLTALPLMLMARKHFGVKIDRADSPQAVWGNGGGHERGRGL